MTADCRRGIVGSDQEEEEEEEIFSYDIEMKRLAQLPVGWRRSPVCSAESMRRMRKITGREGGGGGDATAC